MRRAGLSKDELVERSEHSTPHVLALFEQPDPNPTLRLYLELVHKAGARFHGVINNDPAQVILRRKEIMARENITTVSALSKVAGVNRSQLSTLLNDANPNPTLAVFDRLVVALGAEQDFVLVSYMDKAVAQAVTIGTAEVQAVKREVAARHLHFVPEPARARPTRTTKPAIAAHVTSYILSRGFSSRTVAVVSIPIPPPSTLSYRYKFEPGKGLKSPVLKDLLSVIRPRRAVSNYAYHIRDVVCVLIPDLAHLDPPVRRGLLAVEVGGEDDDDLGGAIIVDIGDDRVLDAQVKRDGDGCA